MARPTTQTKEYGWVDLKEAAEVLGMTKRGVARYASGKYKALETRKFQIGGQFKLLVHIDDVLALKRTREQGKYLNAGENKI